MTTPDHRDQLIFELSEPGRTGYSLPARDVPPAKLEGAVPDGLLRQGVEGFPELTEVGLVRHFTRLSTWNYGVDTGMYPLGSCTMKYRPEGERGGRPVERPGRVAPARAPMKWRRARLPSCTRSPECSARSPAFRRSRCNPPRAAHGELTGMMMIRKHLITRDGHPRKVVLIPDSAHGTNPASAHFCGYEVREIKSCERGNLSVAALAEAMTPDVAALMLTNPNTLGMFEDEICEAARIVHAKGGMVYCDGANMNALMGRARPGDFGMDIMHLNLHKTFSTPHGGGGPGSGPVVATKAFVPYLPAPVVMATRDGLRLDYDRPLSIGRVKAFQGNFGMLVRAYAYIRSLGPKGVRESADNAVLNANYVRARLRDVYDVPYDRLNMHEVILSDHKQNEFGVTTLDIAKRLIDLGFHPPTIYFPLIVHGAMMVEPTESEGLDELDRFIGAMRQIAEEAKASPELLKKAPVTTRRSRFDEATAARKPVLRWKPGI